MSNPEFDDLRRQFCQILRTSASTFRNSALVVEQYANIIESGALPSAHDISQLSMQLPQIPTGGKAKKRGKGDVELNIFDPVPGAGDDGDSKKRKRGAPKKPRDPNAPKRPPSAYLLFQNSVRAQVKEKHPEMSYNEVLAEISKMWADLSESDKKPFVDATAVAREQYEEEKTKYDAKIAGETADVPMEPAGTAPSPSEESDEEPPAPPPVVPAPKPRKSKAAEKPVSKSPPKEKKKKEKTPEPPIESASDDGHDDDEPGSEDEKAPPRKRAKKEKASPPSKKEKKAKEEKTSKKK